MNSFCIYCTGNNKKDIKRCLDKYCPFYPFRFCDIDHKDEAEIARKLLGEIGVTHD